MRMVVRKPRQLPVTQPLAISSSIYICHQRFMQRWILTRNQPQVGELEHFATYDFQRHPSGEGNQQRLQDWSRSLYRVTITDANGLATETANCYRNRQLSLPSSVTNVSRHDGLMEQRPASGEQETYLCLAPSGGKYLLAVIGSNFI